jgi:hypothetical protein
MAALIFPSAVLTHLKVGVRAAAAPEPVLVTVCTHPASAPKQARPSLTTSLRRMEKTWKNAQREWTAAMTQFAIMFGDRFSVE